MSTAGYLISVHNDVEEDWSVGTNWSLGTPPTSSESAIFRTDLPYRVDITTAVTARSLYLNAPALTLVESSTGSMTIRNMNFASGTSTLNGDNSFYTTTINADVRIGSDHALGNRAVTLEAGHLTALSSMTLHNEIDVAIQDAIGSISVQTGDTLTLDGPLALSGAGDGIVFGYNANGTVVIAGKSYSDTGPAPIVDIMYATVASGSAARNVAATGLFQSAGSIDITTGTLDLTHFGAGLTTLHGLSGFGEVENTASLRTLTLSGADYDGNFAGKFALVAEGTNTLGGTLGTVGITMGAGTDTLDLSAAQGSFHISAPAGSNATVTVSGKPGQTDHFIDFQDGHLSIDTTFASDAHVTFTDRAGSVRVTVSPNGGGTAGNLYFDGINSHTHFVVGNDGHGHLELTWSPAEIGPSHDAAVQGAVAEASYVPPPHDAI